MTTLRSTVCSWRQPFLPMKRNRLSLQMLQLAAHRQLAAFLMLVAMALPAVMPRLAIAGGGGVAGATEVTQIANNVELVGIYTQEVESYIQQGMMYATQLKQYETQMRNLLKNPGSDFNSQFQAPINVIRNIGNMMQTGQAIGSTMAQIDKRFGETFNSGAGSAARTYSQKFSSWTNTSKDTLQNSLRSVGMQRDQFQSETDALNQLYDKVGASEGHLQALQTLGQVNMEQTMQMQKLRDLLQTQGIAQNTYMLEQQAKQQASHEADSLMLKYNEMPSPSRPSRSKR